MSNILITSDYLFAEFVLGSTLSALIGGTILMGWLWLRSEGDTGTWPAVKGVVLESVVVVEHDDDGKFYQPAVRYVYEVGGKRFEGSHIRWGAPEHHRKYTGARGTLDNYRPGRTIEVHYDPGRPHIAVLRPDRLTSLRPVLVIGIAAVTYVLFIVSPLFVGR